MNEVTIRGTTYRSYTEAAKAHGVSASAVHKAKLRGTLDNVGMGRHDVSLPCRIHGVEYPSQVKAAEALGVRPVDVNRYLAVRKAATNLKSI